jgi:polygalacturonase
MKMSLCLLAVVGCLASTGFCACGTAGIYDVRSYGAKGDGVTKDTSAVQAAVDAAHAAGGGEVRLGPGTYLSGSIWLKSNVDFHLMAGAVLKGSPDPSDYCASNCCPQNYASSKKGDNTSGGHLLLGVGVRNVTVRGPGMVDGNSDAFIYDKDGRLYKNWIAIPFRPAQMVWFVDSQDIRVTDLELKNAPYWSCFVLNCDRVWIRGCYAHTERRRYHMYNADGFDIDRSRWVQISDCRIDTADDCITLRASAGERLASPQDCAYVTVANCNLSTPCNAVRFGVGEGKIHDIVLSNLTVSDTRTAFNFVGAWSGKSRGTDIYDVRVQNVQVDCQDFVRIHHMYSTKSVFRDIVFDGVSGTVRKRSVLLAKKSCPFANIVFRNVDLPQGFVAVNADVRLEGGTFAPLPIPEAERAKIAEDVESNRNFVF